MNSEEWFRSTDLRVMGPARYLCATSLLIVLILNYSQSHVMTAQVSSRHNGRFYKYMDFKPPSLI